MPAGGSSIYTDAEGYQDSLRGTIDLLVERPREFHARLTWAELPRLRLVRARESSARLAYVTLPVGSVSVTFTTDRGSTLICDGNEVRFGDILFHGSGDRLHQRTTGPTRWGSILLTPATLVAFGATIMGRILTPPSVRQILRPLPVDRRLLLRLHAQAGRMAETVPERIGHREVVRALEQDLLLALLNCLAGRDVCGSCQQPSVLVQLETMLLANHRRLLTVKEISKALGISPQRLRTICSSRLGMSPGRYQRLRRLKLVRAKLMLAGSERTSIVEIMQHYGFADIHRFVTEYRDAYGEMPPMPSGRIDR